MIESFGIQKANEAVISGSFRKHLEQISSARHAFQQAGITVLAPEESRVLNPDEGFVILASDDASLAPVRLETNFMRNIRNADFLYVVDVGGYVGKSAATEMAYACLKGLPVIVSEEINVISDEIDNNVQQLLKKIASNKIAIGEISSESVGRALEQHSKIDLDLAEEKILSGTVRKLLRELHNGVF